ncbi:MAG: hypothetical protein ACRYG7_10320 [Janthinobacterium lividum]
MLNLAALSWPARLVLAEILELHKVNGQVWANDQHFVNRLPGLAKRTVGGAIKELADGGYVVRDTNQSAQHKRILTPSAEWQNLLPIAESAIGAEEEMPGPSEEPGQSAASEAAEPIAESAIGSPELLQILPQPIAESATDLLQNLPQPIAESADINYQLNTIGNTSQTPPPTPAEKKIGEGVFSENSSSALPAEAVVSAPHCEAPQVAESQPLATPAVATEAKQYASVMGKVWKISELKNFRKWALIAAFTKRLADLGQLDEAKRQFSAYAIYLQRARISPYRLERFLGTPDTDYTDGEWCGCEWPEVAAETRARPDESVADATATRAAGAPTVKKKDW